MGTRFIEVIVPFYVALTIFAIIVHYLRVHLIEPIIDFHVDRRNATVLLISVFNLILTLN